MQWLELHSSHCMHGSGSNATVVATALLRMLRIQGMEKRRALEPGSYPHPLLTSTHCNLSNSLATGA